MKQFDVFANNQMIRGLKRRIFYELVVECSAIIKNLLRALFNIPISGEACGNFPLRIVKNKLVRTLSESHFTQNLCHKYPCLLLQKLSSD